MTHTYNITGMTCNGCVTKVKSELLKLGAVGEADVQLTAPQATVRMQEHIPVSVLQSVISKAGTFTITEAAHSTQNMEPAEEKTWLATYKPLLLIGAFITGITLLLEFTADTFRLENLMQNFMAGFFLVFSFFKLLDIKGFAESYATYDVIAKRLPAWGFIYPFVELGLGLAFLLRLNPLLTNGVTFAVMGVSIIGVLQSVLNKQKIRCACLGAVFNLPMSTITIVEDAMMIAMSGIMLISLL
jgi:cation transport ATPase